MEAAEARADPGEPAADQRLHDADVYRDLGRNALPELRIQDARGSCEGLPREQFASPRPDPGRIVVDLEKQGAGGAQIGVEGVVLRLLALELGGRCVVGGRGVLGRRRCVLGFGTSSASLLTDAASLGVMSAIAACRARPKGSFSARRRCKSASVRFGFLSAASIEASAARV